MRIENDPLIVIGWRIDQYATSTLIGVPSNKSVEIEALINERHKILGKKRKFQKDKDRLEELDEIISTLPTAVNPEDQEAMRLIRKAAELIKKKEK